MTTIRTIICTFDAKAYKFDTVGKAIKTETVVDFLKTEGYNYYDRHQVLFVSTFILNDSLRPNIKPKE